MIYRSIASPSWFELKSPFGEVRVDFPETGHEISIVIRLAHEQGCLVLEFGIQRVTPKCISFYILINSFLAIVITFLRVKFRRMSRQNNAQEKINS